MIVLIAKNTFKKENVEKFLAFAPKLVEGTRQEAGCIYYDLVRAKNEENTFYFVEKYVDQTAVDIHNASEYFKTYVPIMRELRESSELILCEEVEF